MFQISSSHRKSKITNHTSFIKSKCHISNTKNHISHMIYHKSNIIYHESNIKSQISNITNDISTIQYHTSNIIHHLSHINNHKSYIIYQQSNITFIHIYQISKIKYNFSNIIIKYHFSKISYQISHLYDFIFHKSKNVYHLYQISYIKHHLSYPFTRYTSAGMAMYVKYTTYPCTTCWQAWSQVRCPSLWWKQCCQSVHCISRNGNEIKQEVTRKHQSGTHQGQDQQAAL